MTGRNIKVPGHAMVKADPQWPSRWDCMCGAWERVLPQAGKTYRELRRNGHDAHKIEVLRSRGELEEEE